MIDWVTFSSFHFLRPWWLCLLVMLVVVSVHRLWKTRKDKIDHFIAPHLAEALTVSAGKRSWFNPWLTSLLTLCLGSIIMAGPSWERQDSPFVQDQAVLVILLDLSSTMAQKDIQPSRLSRAKLKILDLLELRGKARTGVVVFAGSAHQLLPLTNDPGITKQFLAAADHVVMPIDGSRAERAIPIVERMLSTANTPGSVLLLSDGLDSSSAAQLQEHFALSDSQLIVYAMGSEQRPSGENDHAAFIALQKAQLEDMASVSESVFQMVTADKSDVLRINRLIKHHRDVSGDDSRPWLDAGFYLLIPFAFLLLFSFRSGWALSVLLFLNLGVGSLQPSVSYAAEGEEVVERSQTLADRFLRIWLTPDQLGRYYFEQGEYLKAANLFENTDWQATAFYYAEKFGDAAILYAQSNTELSRFNLANSYAQSQHYPKAIDIYSDLLNDFPQNEPAQANRQRLQDLVDEINQMSESQRAEAGKQTRELGDEPQRADGAESDSEPAAAIEQLSASQLLADQQILSMWMRQVQADPKRFLGAKFQLQYQQQKTSNEFDDE